MRIDRPTPDTVFFRSIRFEGQHQWIRQGDLWLEIRDEPHVIDLAQWLGVSPAEFRSALEEVGYPNELT